MDSSDSLSDSCSDNTLSCSTSSFGSKVYSDDTDEEMDKEINSNIEPYQCEPAEESLLKEKNNIYKRGLDNMNWYNII